MTYDCRLMSCDPKNSQLKNNTVVNQLSFEEKI